MDAFPCMIVWAYPPIDSVASVKYLDADLVEQTLAATDYLVDKDSEPGLVYLKPGKSWPSTASAKNAVRVRYTCGYGAGACPQAVKQWMMLQIGAMYANRESVAPGSIVEMPFADRLLDSFRVWSM
jgi:uncharacterized phiE125 gp8 family phage protein